MYKFDKEDFAKKTATWGPEDFCTYVQNMFLDKVIFLKETRITRGAGGEVRILFILCNEVTYLSTSEFPSPTIQITGPSVICNEYSPSSELVRKEAALTHQVLLERFDGTLEGAQAFEPQEALLAFQQCVGSIIPEVFNPPGIMRLKPDTYYHYQDRELGDAECYIKLEEEIHPKSCDVLMCWEDEGELRRETRRLREADLSPARFTVVSKDVVLKFCKEKLEQSLG